MKNAMKNLVIAAGLNVQHACHVCGVLLDAFGRESSEGLWVCPEHKATAGDRLGMAGPEGVTCAERYEADA